MNKTVVSIIATLVCVGCLALVALFGYGRYRAAKEKDAQFSSALQNPADRELTVRMPAQLGNPSERRTRQDQKTLDQINPIKDEDARSR